MTTTNSAGHAPEALRKAFHEWIGEGCVASTVRVDGEEVPVQRLLGRLRFCTDLLPPEDCRILGIPCGSTYGKAVTVVSL